MNTTVNDFAIQCRRQWDISRIYGCWGEGINRLTAALCKAENNPRFIQSRHEEKWRLS
jgi:pyruvate dehydrogenase (quinone)